MHIVSAQAPFAFLQRSEPLHFKKPHLGRLTNHGRTSVKLNWQLIFSSTYLILAKLAASNRKPPLQNKTGWTDQQKFWTAPAPPSLTKVIGIRWCELLGSPIKGPWPSDFPVSKSSLGCLQLLSLPTLKIPFPKTNGFPAKNEGLERWFCRFQRGGVVFRFHLSFFLLYVALLWRCQPRTISHMICSISKNPQFVCPIPSQKTIGSKNSPQKKLLPVVHGSLVGGWTNPFEKYARQTGHQSSSPIFRVKTHKIQLMVQKSCWGF